MSPRTLTRRFRSIPIGARVAYLPRVTEDSSKHERFDSYVRYGIFFGYAQDLVPAQGYWICDQTERFQRGRLKIVAAEVVHLLAVATPEGENRLVYPFLSVRNAARERAVNAIQASLPKVKATQDENSAKRRREANLVAHVPETLLALSQVDDSDDDEQPLPGETHSGAFANIVLTVSSHSGNCILIPT